MLEELSSKMIDVLQHNEVRRFRIARTMLGRGWYHTAAFWVDGLMVDSGCAHTVPELLAVLGCRDQNVGGGLEGSALRVHTVVSTHCHEDHIAGNAALQRCFGARVLAHPLALPVLAAPRELQPQQIYRRIVWGYPEPVRGAPLGETVETPRHSFRVVHTPGHSPDHICLFEPRRGWLFCGDAFVGGRDRALRVSANVWEIVASLRRLAGLDAELLFCGSGTIHEQPALELRRKIDYLEELGGRVVELHRRGWGIARIRRALFGREELITCLTQGDFSGTNLVRSYIDNAPSSPDLPRCGEVAA